MSLLKFREIEVPKYLWKLHGQKTSKLDLILTYSLALIVMLFNIVFAYTAPLWKIIVIAIISLDIGGGIISNFTKGTIEYYRQSKLSPHSYIWFHLFQIIILVILYPAYIVQVGVISILILLFSSLIIGLNNATFQKQISVFLFVITIIVLFFNNALPVSLHLLLILLALKLIVGFSSNVKSSLSNNTR